MRGNKFRNLKRFLKGYFAFLVAIICTIIGLCSCDKVKNTVCSTSGVDSVYVAEYVEAVTNPIFTSIEEVKIAQKQLTEEKAADEVFMYMSDDVLNNVVTVCLNKNTFITKRDIVAEYRANQTVYDNLSTSDSTTHKPINNTTTAKEEQQKPAGRVSYHYEMDTVEGTPKRVLVKEERTYE